MPSDFNGSETAVFFNTVLGADSQMLSRYLDEVMIKTAYCAALEFNRTV